MKQYTTRQGDMWDGIAYREMGDVKYTDELMRANAEHREVFIFSQGVQLVIPDVEQSETVTALPPWKRVNV